MSMNRQPIHLIALGTLLHLALCGFAAEFYVAPSGNDANPGTRSRPFATPERARDEVRQLRQGGRLGKGAVTIAHRGDEVARVFQGVLEDGPHQPVIIDNQNQRFFLIIHRGLH